MSARCKIYQPTSRSVFKALLWLKRPLAFRQRTSFIVDGIWNPSRYVTMRFINSTGAEKDRMISDCGMGTALLIDNVARRRVYNTAPVPVECLNVSQWAIIPDERWDKLDSMGLTPVRKVLHDAMKAFKEYDLDTDEGIEEAIQDMMRRLSTVTDVSKVYVAYPQSCCP